MKSVKYLMALAVITAVGLSGGRSLGASVPLSGTCDPVGVIVVPEGADTEFDLELHPTGIVGHEDDLFNFITLTIHGNVALDVHGAGFIKLRNDDTDAPLEASEFMASTGVYGVDWTIGPTVGTAWIADEKDDQLIRLLGTGDKTWTLNVSFAVPMEVWTVDTDPGWYRHTTHLTIAPH